MKLRAVLIMLFPVLVLYVYSFIVPMVMVGQLALSNSDYVKSEFVGLRNFVEAFKDKYFTKSFANSFWFVLLIAPIKITLCYRIASFLTTFSKRVQSMGRFMLYIPSLTSGLIMALIWKWFLHRKGLINLFLALTGIDPIPWLAQPWTARIAISIIIIISGVGFYVIVFSAQMLSVPKELYDAAIIDGASERQYKQRILFPMMISTILLMLLLQIVGIMQIWELCYVLTGEGGPKGSTASPAYDVFQTAFRFGRQGYAAAKGIILMLAIAAVLLMKRKVEKWLDLEN